MHSYFAPASLRLAFLVAGFAHVACDGALDGAPSRSPDLREAASGYYHTDCGDLYVTNYTELVNATLACTSIAKLEINDPNGTITNLHILNEIDSFGYCSPYNENPPCHGGLIIDSAPALTSLSGLDFTTSIYSLHLEHTGLLDLTGLGRIAELHDVVISDNPALTSLHGIQWSAVLDGAMTVRANASLIDLSGLEFMVNTNGMLLIDANPSLTSLTGLDNLTSLGGALTITGNPGLKSIAALANLTSIGGAGLEISNNAALTTTASMNSLVDVGAGSVEIASNPMLGEVTCLWYLTTIGGDLIIKGNKRLSAISLQVAYVGGTFDVENNSALRSLRLSWLVQVGTTRGVPATFRVLWNPALASITAPSLTSVYPFGLSSAPQSNDVYIQGNLSYPNVSARALATQAHEGTKNVYGNL